MKPVLILVCALGFLACGEGLSNPMDFDREEVVRFRAADVVAPGDPDPAALRVMTWNIKFGGARIDFFFDLYGSRVVMTEEEISANMDGIYTAINDLQPDILVAQEVEVNSQRSNYVDMVQGILDNTHLNYGAYFQSWDVRDVPLEGMGRVDMGVAIFSTHPITFAERIKQVDRSDQDTLGEIFYVHRVVGRALIETDSREIATYVVHTEAYDTDGTKGKQLEEVYELVMDESLPWMLGGDFNSLPPNAAKLSDFPDEPGAAGDTRFPSPEYNLEEMAPFFADMTPAVTEAQMGDTEASQRDFYTHSVLGPHMDGNDGEPGYWNRTLDYLFVAQGQSWQAGTTGAVQDAGDFGVTRDPMLLSDHCPVVGTWVLP